MDREFADRDKEKLHAILASHPKIKGYHDLKTRYAANKPFIQVHIELDSKMTLKESHQIAEELESYIFAVFPEADVIIHQDPDDVEETQHFKH
jgi:divalent metal cation (Fe/Co/Zn/Cd) transporter